MHQVSITPLSAVVSPCITQPAETDDAPPVTSATQIDDITPTARHVTVATAHMATFDLIQGLITSFPNSDTESGPFYLLNYKRTDSHFGEVQSQLRILFHYCLHTDHCFRVISIGKMAILLVTCSTISIWIRP